MHAVQEGPTDGPDSTLQFPQKPMLEQGKAWAILNQKLGGGEGGLSHNPLHLLWICLIFMIAYHLSFFGVLPS